MTEVAVKLEARPTGFVRFMLRHWYIGIFIAPFIRFMPAKWLVECEASN